jgi:hypothetical protein
MKLTQLNMPHFDGRTQGALVVCFDDKTACGEIEKRLIDAAAQQASMAAHISSLYAAARASSQSLAEEVKRRTKRQRCSAVSRKRLSTASRFRCMQLTAIIRLSHGIAIANSAGRAFRAKKCLAVIF